MNKIEEIFKAWNIAFNPDSEQSELASKRIEICNSCEHKVTNLGINRCSVCGCALKAKVFSPVKGACPKGKWDKVDEVFKIKEPEKKPKLIDEYKENLSIVAIGKLISDEEHQRYLDFVNDKNTNWGKRTPDNYWSGRVIHHPTFNHLKSDSHFQHLETLNIFLLEKFRSKLKSNFKIKHEIYPEYLSLIKWEMGDVQIPRADSTEDLYSYRDFSCIYHLNDDYDGGEIYFPKQDVIMKPTANTLIIFPSNSDYEHGVMPIKSGVRHTITSFWTFDKDHNIKLHM